MISGPLSQDTANMANNVFEPVLKNVFLQWVENLVSGVVSFPGAPVAVETWTMNRAETRELSAAATDCFSWNPKFADVHTVTTSASFKKTTASAMFSSVTSFAAHTIQCRGHLPAALMPAQISPFLQS